jgi:hypothetical protein
MSVKARIDDARVLWQAGRKEGALLSVCIAVAATSRKRYPRDCNPRKTDREAFTGFLSDEIPRIVTFTSSISLRFRGEILRLKEILYKFVRCELAHEAELPEDVYFMPGDKIAFCFDDNKLGMSEKLIEVLLTTVTRASENRGLFAEANPSK